ncbi:MAG TPA: hypothetical protein VLZ83_01050 [Edaphocola sp.]|nr:hypothetical protein [Edaphocola sp.]
MSKNKLIFSLLAILGFILLSRFSALNKPHHVNYDTFRYEYQDQDGPDTNKKKVIVTEAYLKPGSQEFKDSMIQARKQYVDSLKAAQEAQRDSISTERQRIADSTAQSLKKYNDSLNLALEEQRNEQKRISDSIKAIQQLRKDSLERIQIYKNSKEYKDSVAAVKQHRIDSITKIREARADSLANERIRIKDSLTVARKHFQDSLEQVKKNNQDSLNLVRKTTQDSLQLVRKNTQDSLEQVRKQTLDSLEKARKQMQDSLLEEITAQRARNQFLRDSLTAERKVRSDSIAKVKAEREALANKRITDREKEKNAKARKKEKDNREAYTNESMRNKPWNFIRRSFHNTTTRFNYYFNGNERLYTIEQNMLKNANNQYDKLLPLLPFDPDVDSSKYASDLDSLIRKASVGIQIHDPRSKWQDNLYFLIGKSYYYKGDYKNAAAAFKFIISTAESDKKEKALTKKDKKALEALGSLADKESKSIFQHQSSKNDATMWLAIVLAQDSSYNLAQTVLNMLHSSKQYDPKLMDGRFAMAQSFLDLKADYKNAAIEHLKPLYQDKSSPNWLRQRAAFISGQLLQNEQAYAAADSAFNEVIKLNPNLEMEFFARMNIIDNNIISGNFDSRAMLSKLGKMSKETKFKEYYDKIFFAQALVYEKENDKEKAINSYQKSIKTNQKNTVQKGISFAGMANLYYESNKYTEAKSYYDSSLLFLTETEQPTFAIAERRAGALTYIAQPGEIVHFTDSILTLAGKSEKEQKDIIKKYLNQLEKHLLDSLYIVKNTSSAPTALPQTVTLSKSKSNWYFSNANNIQKGSTAFKQKWGNRTLKDNWNRSDLSSSITDGGLIDDKANLSEEDQLRATMPTEEELFAQIPKKQNEIDSANNVLEQNLYLLGIGYYKRMSDMIMALKTFDTLDSRFPNHAYSAEINYYRYLIALNNNEQEQAQKYLNLLKNKYASTEWAKLAIPDKQEQVKTSNFSIADHYAATYSALMNQEYNDALNNASTAPSLFPKGIAAYKKKYDLISYAAITGLGQYKQADSLLTQFIANNQNDETISWAIALQKLVKEKLTAQNAQAVGSGSSEPVVINTGGNKSFVFNPTNLHYVLIASNQNNDNRIIGLRAGLQELNKTAPAYKNIDLSMTQLTAQKSILATSEFKNMVEAKKYINFIKKEKKVFQAFNNSNEYDILMISNDNIILLYTEKNWDDYKTFYKSNY